MSGIQYIITRVFTPHLSYFDIVNFHENLSSNRMTTEPSSVAMPLSEHNTGGKLLLWSWTCLPNSYTKIYDQYKTLNLKPCLPTPLTVFFSQLGTVTLDTLTQEIGKGTQLAIVTLKNKLSHYISYKWDTVLQFVLIII